MQRRWWTFLLILALLVLSGCPRPLLAPSLSAARPDQTPYSDQITIRGQIKRSDFQVQATLTEIASASTVSLMDVTSGQTLGSTVTNSSGQFVLSFGAGFHPTTNALYILEAVKGLQAGATPNRAGASAARIRTLLQWTGTNWNSITGASILVSPATTALCVIDSLRRFSGVTPAVSETALIGSITEPPPPATESFNPGASNISSGDFAAVYNLVNAAITLDSDPLYSITYNTATQTYSRTTTAVGANSVLPAVASIGQTVVINGSNFVSDVTQDRVFFNTQQATNVSVNNIGTQLTVQVPPGATTGPLTVRIGDVIFGGMLFTVKSWDGHTPFDLNGNLFVAAYGNNTLWQIGPDGTLTKLASGGLLNSPRGTAFYQGKVYVSNWGNGSILQYDPSTGGLSTYATGLSNPWGLCVDPSGNLYVANYGNNSVSKIAPGGTVSTYATGFNQPSGVAFDPTGNLWVSNWNGNSISEVATGTLTVTTPLSGGGLSNPGGLAFDSTGNLLIANYGANQLMRYNGSLLVPFLSNPGIHRGMQQLAYNTNGLLYVGAWDSHTFFTLNPLGGIKDLLLIPRSAYGITKDAANNLYISVNNNNTRTYGYYAKDSRIYRMLYTSSTQTYGPPLAFLDGFGDAHAIAFDSNGLMYVADALANRIYQVNPTTGVKTIFVDNVGNVAQMAFDSTNRLYVSLRNDVMVRYTSAGTLDLTYSYQDRNLRQVAIGSDGYYYATSWREGVIEKINATTGETSRWVTGLTNVDGIVSNGNYLFVAEWGANRIARYDVTTGPSSRTVYCDTGLSNPSGLAFNPGTNVLYVANFGNGSIVSIPWGGLASGVAATSMLTGLPTTGSQRPQALPLAFSTNTLWSADMRPSNRYVIKIDVSTATPSVNATFAQIPAGIDSLDGTPFGIAAHSNGNLYVTDGRRWWSRLVQVNMTTAAVTPFSATNGWYSGLTIDASGNLVAANCLARGYNGAHVVKFDTSGNVLGSYGSEQWKTQGVAIDASDHAYSVVSSWGNNQHYINRMTSDTSWVRDTNLQGYPGAGAYGQFNLYLDKPTGDKYLTLFRDGRGYKIAGSNGAVTSYTGLGNASGLINTPNGDLYATSMNGAVGNAPIVKIPASVTSSGGSAVVPDNYCYQPAF